MALSLALSCVTAPGIRTSDVAELHYGDREEAVVEKLGDGAEVLYFELDREQYRYRLYTTQYTKDVYALLFMNGKLVAVHDEKQDFSECLNFEAGISWEHCLSDRLAEMRFHDISLGSHDFSHGIKTQQEEQAERDKMRAGAIAVAVPLTVVLPGIVPVLCIASCGQCDMGVKDGDYPIPCIDSLASTLSQSVDILQGSLDHESIAQQLGQIQHEKNIYNAGSGENIKDDQAILYYSWSCVSYGDYYYLSIRVGLSDGKLKWAWIRYGNHPEI
jgi:hypothetical protein